MKASSKWMELEILNDYLPIIHLDKQFLHFLNYNNLKLYIFFAVIFVIFYYIKYMNLKK